jgi:nicotinamide-nucleotide amidase
MECVFIHWDKDRTRVFPPDLVATAEDLLATLRQRGLRLVTAESCTGGAIAGVVTEVAGSSDVFERGYVTYSNDAKIVELSVPAKMIAAEGAVSIQVAESMARGAVTASGADISVAVTGIAGPSGGSADKPVGLVYLAAASAEGKVLSERQLFGDIGRGRVREETVKAALALVLRLVATA